MNISVIIPNYNGEQLLSNNLPSMLESIEGYDQGEKELIIVDDCSTDSSVEIIKEFIKKNKKTSVHLTMIQNEKNLGFSSTVNKGVKKSTGEIIVLFNTDVIPEIGFANKLPKYFFDPQHFAIGFLDKSIEDGKIILRGRGIGSWKKGLLMHNRGEIDKKNTLWASGGSSAFKKDLWEKLGGFHAVYNPFYWEDIDLSYRALKAGYTIAFDPEIRVIHQHEAGSIRTQYLPATYTAIAYRNAFLFVWINITDPLLLISHIMWFPYHLVKTLSVDKAAFIHGFLQAVKIIPAVIILRKKVKSMQRLSDQQILTSFLS